mgnify:CR=1 FL=1
MTKIAVAGFQHETNTFAPQPTTFKIFEERGAWPELTRGESLIKRFLGLNLPISGFISACNHKVEPILWAAAEPGGFVDNDAFDLITNEIVEGIIESKPDAVYLDLHGAMVTRKYDDGEAEILRRIREAAGYDLPLAVSLDLHGNLSKSFFDLADLVTIYRTYPHVDLAETGARAADLLSMSLKKPLKKAWRRANFLIPVTAQGTDYQPSKNIYNYINKISQNEVASIDLAMGFPPADIPELGPVIVAYDQSQRVANDSVEKVFKKLLEAEPIYNDRLVSAEDAVAEAVKSINGPVVIADVQDNPGAGGTGDTTGLISALIKAQASDAILSMLYDPHTAEAAHIAGVGSEIDVSLGGKFTTYSKPIKCKVLIEAISDGRFLFTGPMFGGSDADLGPVALLKISDTSIRVVVGSKRAQNADQEMFRVVGLEPCQHKIICVKSAMHFVADYKQVSKNIIFATSPGANPCNLTEIPYKRLLPGIRLGPCGPSHRVR